MAIVTRIVDDLDNSVDADETVNFALDGVEYSVDLSSEHAEELREAFEKYVQHGRRTGGRVTRNVHTGRARVAVKPGMPAAGVSQSQADQRAENRQAREWARLNGFPNVSSKGRIPDRVLVAFRNRDAEPTVSEGEKVGGELTLVRESGVVQEKPKVSQGRSTSPRSARKTPPTTGTVHS